MKKIYAVLLLSLLGACASRDPIASLPNTTLIVDRAMPPLSRNEVMNGDYTAEEIPSLAKKMAVSMMEPETTVGLPAIKKRVRK